MESKVITHKTTQCLNSKDHNMNLHSCENLKLYTEKLICTKLVAVPLVGREITSGL